MASRSFGVHRDGQTIGRHAQIMGSVEAVEIGRDLVPRARFPVAAGPGGVDLDHAAGVQQQLGVALLDGQDRNGIAEKVGQIGARGGRRIDHQAVAEDALPVMEARRQMGDVVRLGHRRRIAGRTSCGSLRRSWRELNLRCSCCCALYGVIPDARGPWFSSSSVRLK